MRSEGDFNSKFSENARRIPKLLVMKTSDRFAAGVSDFLFFANGRCLAMETKFVSKWPKKGKLLGHPFTGEQQTFLESMEIAGHIAIGLVAIEEAKRMYTICRQRIPDSGNWKVDDFKNYEVPQVSFCPGPVTYGFPWLDARSLIEFYLGKLP